MSKTRESYHHGDLRKALIEAGEAVLADTGRAGFSLRQVARKVGVSHSAPAHHFGDTNGLLAALATEAFRRFIVMMEDRQRDATDDPREQLLASGLGYLDFAASSPALFRLMFGEECIDPMTDELAKVSQAAFLHLARDTERLCGASPFDDPRVMARVMAIWSLVHGFAELQIFGLARFQGAMEERGRDQLFRQALLPLMAPIEAGER